MRVLNLFYIGFYLTIAVLTTFDITEVSKILHILMALSLALTFAKEVKGANQ
jgi:hypothetical protein